MPPKPKITKEMILNTVLKITRESGFEAVNARSIAKLLKCSTRPIFTCYGSMEELKREFLDFAFEYYEKYTSDYDKSKSPKPYLLLPLSYIDFAEKETFLFRFLFISDIDLSMTDAGGFYREPGNEEKARIFAKMLNIEINRAKEIFLDLFLYSHGIAVLTAAGKLSLGEGTAEKMICNFLSAFINR